MCEHGYFNYPSCTCELLTAESSETGLSFCSKFLLPLKTKNNHYRSTSNFKNNKKFLQTVTATLAAPKVAYATNRTVIVSARRAMEVRDATSASAVTSAIPIADPATAATEAPHR